MKKIITKCNYLIPICIIVIYVKKSNLIFFLLQVQIGVLDNVPVMCLSQEMITMYNGCDSDWGILEKYG